MGGSFHQRPQHPRPGGEVGIRPGRTAAAVGGSCPRVPARSAFPKGFRSAIPSCVPDSSRSVCSIEHFRILKIFPLGLWSPSQFLSLLTHSFHWDPWIKGSNYGWGEVFLWKEGGAWANPVHPPLSFKKHQHCCHLLYIGFSRIPPLLIQLEAMFGVQSVGS